MSTLKGFIYCAAPHLKCPFSDITYHSTTEWIYDNRDGIPKNDNYFTYSQNSLSFFDGFILNKSELYHGNDWKHFYISNAHNINFINSLRGSFTGILRTNNNYIFWCDHTGNRNLFYYFKGSILIISSRLDFIIQVFKHNNIPLKINREAIEYITEFGFIQSNITIIDSVYRVLPGERISINNRKIDRYKYFTLGNCNSLQISKENAIELLDFYFKQAISREYNYDCISESGSEHLVDLSGGLDSRMTMLVAYTQGFKKQTNLCLSSYDHLDHHISKEISNYFKTKYAYYDSDNNKWLNHLNYILSLTNYCSSIYPHGQLLNIYCNKQHIGKIRHTGTMGDIILSSLYSSYTTASSCPKTRETPYTRKISFEHDEFRKYNNKEIFVLNTTGLLGIQSSNGIVQNFGECYSPFLDVDFSSFVLSLPFEYRKNHNIYIEWINKYYPLATKFAYERWNGLLPTANNLNYVLRNGIPPSPKTATTSELNFAARISSIYLLIKPDIDRIINSFSEYAYLSTLFNNGNNTEKCLALSALLMLKTVYS